MSGKGNKDKTNLRRCMTKVNEVDEVDEVDEMAISLGVSC